MKRVKTDETPPGGLTADTGERMDTLQEALEAGRAADALTLLRALGASWRSERKATRARAKAFVDAAAAACGTDVMSALLEWAADRRLDARALARAAECGNAPVVFELLRFRPWTRKHAMRALGFALTELAREGDSERPRTGLVHAALALFQCVRDDALEAAATGGADDDDSVL